VTDPFEVVAAGLSLSLDGGALTAWLDAPGWGYRLVHLDGDDHGQNPLVDAFVTWEMGDGSEVVDDAVGVGSGTATAFAVEQPGGAVAVRVEDAWGNAGRLDLGR
jgi:hypothetical protein